MNEKQSVCILGDGIHALSVATALASSGYYTTIVAPPDAFENSVFGHDDAHLMVDMMYYRNKILYHDQLIDLFDKACHQKLISFCTISQIKKNNPHFDGCWFFYHQGLLGFEHNILAWINEQNFPYVLLSGRAPLGKFDTLANTIKATSVCYVPLTFFKKYEPLNSILSPEMLTIGERAPNDSTKIGIFDILQSDESNVYHVDIRTAEFTRLSISAMLASRLSMVNELSSLADEANVNINEAMEMVGKDSRIGPAYLNPGWGFGGTTLPEELVLLKNEFTQHHITQSMIAATQRTNDEQKEEIFRKFWQYFNTDISDKVVTIWFAIDEASHRCPANSAIHPLLKLLWSHNIQTHIYEKHKHTSLSDTYQNVSLCHFSQDYFDGLEKSDALIILTSYSEVITADLSRLAKYRLPIFDAQNCIAPVDIDKLQGDYIGIGKNRLLNASSHG